jgi:hypothetical protein
MTLAIAAAAWTGRCSCCNAPTVYSSCAGATLQLATFDCLPRRQTAVAAQAQACVSRFPSRAVATVPPLLAPSLSFVLLTRVSTRVFPIQIVSRPNAREFIRVEYISIGLVSKSS